MPRGYFLEVDTFWPMLDVSFLTSYIYVYVHIFYYYYFFALVIYWCGIFNQPMLNISFFLAILSIYSTTSDRLLQRSPEERCPFKSTCQIYSMSCCAHI